MDNATLTTCSECEMNQHLKILRRVNVTLINSQNHHFSHLMVYQRTKTRNFAGTMLCSEITLSRSQWATPANLEIRIVIEKVSPERCNTSKIQKWVSVFADFSEDWRDDVILLSYLLRS